MNFTKLEDGSYETHVASADKSRQPYRVVVERNTQLAGGVEIICGCLGWEHRRKCRHQQMVYTELLRLRDENDTTKRANAGRD